MLRDFGFGEIGEIIAPHTDIFSGGGGASLEAKIVFLADKYIRDVEPVSTEERYRLAGKKGGAIPGVPEKIQRYRSDALKIKEELESIIGCSLDRIVLQKDVRGITE
jgi:hypothetical protein